MLLLDLNDTCNFITLGVNYDFWKKYLLGGKETCPLDKMVPFIDEQPMPAQFEQYIEDEYKRFVPSLFFSYDAAYVLVNSLEGQFHVLYRGHTSKHKYAETGGIVCEEVKDVLDQFGVHVKVQYNVSFYINVEEASELLSSYDEIATASLSLASIAAQVESIKRIYYFVTSWNSPEIAKEVCGDKLFLVDNIFHMTQVRNVANPELFDVSKKVEN